MATGISPAELAQLDGQWLDTLARAVNDDRKGGRG